MSIPVNIDNFVEAENSRMFRDLQAQAGGVNTFSHNRVPSPIDNQFVVRLNRDTLYSFATVDLRGGLKLTLPDAGDRYLSAMFVDQTHHISVVLHEPGVYEVTEEAVGSRWAAVAIRILVDAESEQDLAEVARLQDGLHIEASSAEPFVMADFDVASLDATRELLLRLGDGLVGMDHLFGTVEETTETRHLIGTAAGWGGLPTKEAVYVSVLPPGEGRFELEMAEVPVDGFWSISVYNAQGYFVPNDRDSYTINNITAAKNANGSVTVRFGDFDDDVDNVIPTPAGWNFLVRLYQPKTQVLDGTWQVPSLVPVD